MDLDLDFEGSGPVPDGRAASSEETGAMEVKLEKVYDAADYGPAMDDQADLVGSEIDVTLSARVREFDSSYGSVSVSIEAHGRAEEPGGGQWQAFHMTAGEAIAFGEMLAAIGRNVAARRGQEAA